MFSEQDVDRELKAALAVSPSPDFEARVRQRVEADRPSHWRAHYGWLAAAACVLVAAGVFYALHRAPLGGAPPSPTQIVERTAPPAVNPPRAPQVPQNAVEPPRVERVREPRVAAPSAAQIARRGAEPEVIVPVNQMDAVRRLVRAVNEGRIKPLAQPLEGPMAPPEKLAVVPLVVEPITVPPVVPGAETPAPTVRSLK